MSKTPQWIGIKDIILYQTYLVQKKAQDELLESVKRMQEECKGLRQKVMENQETVHKVKVMLDQ